MRPVYADHPGSVMRYPDGSVDVDPPYSADEQARDDWLDGHDAEMQAAEDAYRRPHVLRRDQQT